MPGCVGMPEITPAVERLSPVGNVPASTLHTNGLMPPDTESVLVYSTCSPAAVKLAVVINGNGAIVNVSGKVALAPTESVTVTDTVKVPLVAGVPLTTPSTRDKPSGKSPAVIAHVVDPTPLTDASEYEYPTSTSPKVGEVVEMYNARSIKTVNVARVGRAWLSVTRTVKVLVPVAVGVPDRIPPRDNVRPAGKLPPARVQL